MRFSDELSDYSGVFEADVRDSIVSLLKLALCILIL